MTSDVDSLILDLLAFIGEDDRPYHDVMEAWRTSCPRLPVWEEANARGLVVRAHTNGAATVRLTEEGRALLIGSRRHHATGARS